MVRFRRPQPQRLERDNLAVVDRVAGMLSIYFVTRVTLTPRQHYKATKFLKFEVRGKICVVRTDS